MSAPTYRRRGDCRACGHPSPSIFLRMGPQPLANALAPAGGGAAAERFPLDVGLCEACGLVQTPDVVDPGRLFADYPYLTGISATMRAHFSAYARAISARLGLGSSPGWVVEVGSNDGSLLAGLARAGVPVVGVDPAEAAAAVAEGRGVPTEVALFDQGVADALRHARGPAAAVVANNVLAHVDEPLAFLKACRSLVAQGGYVVVEVPHLGALVETLAWDTIYHEHLSYFSVPPLLALAAAAGLGVVEIEAVSVHGGSARLWMQPGVGHGASAQAWARRDRGWLTTLPALDAFSLQLNASVKAIDAFVNQTLGDGYCLAGYGAAAKATVLLNRVGIGVDRIPWVVDASPMKVGRAIPGVGTPIRPTGALLDERPDRVLVFARNLIDEIVGQQRAFVAGGGRFVLPLPSPRVR